ncbi:MAG TPA: Gfo/Idh/MocA family oxidoreductase [Gemmatimonadales bacterium]|nr:Gfo/Idh/MocA family oxidoreductase [Gemmatimonadales bacterium]
MRARLPVGVIGVGALGQHHARHLARLKEVQLVGVCDLDAGRCRKIADELGTAAFVEIDDLLARAEAVTVAVPTPAHAQVGLRALEMSVPVLMEKPLAATLEEADRLIAMARRRRVQLQVGHIERYNRALRAAEPYLDGPRYIESQRLAPFQPRGTDVAVVLDLMIHDLDLVLHLTGGSAATEVRASGISVLSSHLDLANARVEFANGAVAQATASRVARERIRRLRLFQPNGYFSLDLASGGGEFMRVRPGWQPGTGRELADVVERIELQAPEADALALELQSFVHAVQGQREVVVRGEEGRAALALALRVADAVRTQPLAASTH